MIIKTLLLSLFLVFGLATSAFAALVEGTNCGFVLEAPTADPEGASTTTWDTFAIAIKFTAPASGTVIEIGGYTGIASEEANFEVGLYSHDAVDDKPDTLLGSNKTNAKGTDAGWKKGSVSIPITQNVIYWITIELDNTTTTTLLDHTTNAAYKMDRKSTATLPDPSWGASTDTLGRLGAIYAVYTTTTARRRIIMVE